VRLATVLHLFGAALVYFGLASPIETSVIVPNSAAFLESRGDFLGVISGLGIISWGPWQKDIRAQRLV